MLIPTPTVWPVFCESADGETACFISVRALPPADRAALAELLPPAGEPRRRMVFDETVCDEHGRPPDQKRLDAVAPRLHPAAVDRLYRMACSLNQLPIEVPSDPA